MSTIIQETETRADEASRPELPDETYLENRMPEWFKAPRVLAGFTTLLGVLYLFFSYRPLWHTDLWGHLAYGRWMWEQGALPSTEPLMPLAAGVRFVDTAWLSQLIGYGMHTAFGNAGIQFLYATSILLCLTLVVWRCYHRTRAAWITAAGCCAFLWVDWQQLGIVRPQLAGLVCFTTLMFVLTSRTWSRWQWFFVPALFVAWANLHGSFPVGLLMLTAYLGGRGLDVFRRTGRLTAIVHDRRVRRYFVLLELAAAAVLLNPYGIAIYPEVFSVAANNNVADLVEWEPLTLKMKQGQAAAVLALLLVVLYRFSPRRVSATEVFLLVGFGASAMWMSRMLLWWAPLAAYYGVLHASAVWKRYRSRRGLPRERVGGPSRPTWAVASIGLVWIFFAYTPFGVTMLHGTPPNSEKSFSSLTPMGAVEYLNEHPPRGLVFNTYQWGDYLLYAGPRDMQVFVASHAHLVPEEVWRDYMHVAGLGADWQEIFDRYSVNTIVVDLPRRRALAGALRESDQWQVDYEDNRSIVLTRRQPI